MSENLHEFETLEGVPNEQGYPPNGYIMFDKKTSSLYSLEEDLQVKYLFKYSFETDSWIKHAITPSPDRFVGNNAVAMDYDQQKIFINHKQSLLGIITLNNDNPKYELYVIYDENEVMRSHHGSKGIVINNKFHIIAGETDKHVEYDPITGKLQVVYDFKDLFEGVLWSPEIQRIDHKILMFGGSNYDENGDGGPVDWIYEGNIVTHEWHKSNSKLPKPLSGFASTLILNEQYVALFGGYSIDEIESDDIFLYSLSDGTLIESGVKCPLFMEEYAEAYQAFTISDRKKDEIISVGYVKSIWKECGLNDDMLPPEELMKIICDYYLNEYVHLLADYDNYGKHYKIDVLRLFDCNP